MPDLEPARALAERIRIDCCWLDHTREGGPGIDFDAEAAAELLEQYAAEVREQERAGCERRIAELESVLALEADAREADRFRLQTIVDERIGIEPVLTADELITIVERTLGEWHRRNVEQSERIASLEAKVPRWIPVGELNAAVQSTWWVWCGAGDRNRYTAMWDGSEWLVPGPLGWQRLICVTHATPLPSPPAEPEKEERRG